jgi:hypothetical protein
MAVGLFRRSCRHRNLCSNACGSRHVRLSSASEVKSLPMQSSPHLRRRFNLHAWNRKIHSPEGTEQRNCDA